MSKILVTGSKGVIGKWLIGKLKQKGHSVFGIDLTHGIGEIGYAQRMAHTDFTYARCDIAEFRQIERIITQDNFDFVYNCAAEFGRWNGEDFYEQVWKTNVIGLKHLLKLQEKNKFKLIHFSSSEVYGDYKDVMVESIMNQEEIKQLNDYALSKWTNEQQITNAHSMYGNQIVVVRIFNTYGPGEYYHPYRSVNAKFCYNLLHNIPIDVYPGHRRTSTYLEDSVNTIANICENFKSGEVYNIGGSKLHTIEELVETIINYTNVSKELVNFKASSEIMTTKDKLVDVSKSVRDLNHKNTVSLENGVKKTIDWMRKVYEIS